MLGLNQEPQLPQMDNTKADLVDPIPTPHWGSQSGVAFTITATATIKAQPQLILDTLLNTSTWPQWNRFVPRASLSDAPREPEEASRLRPGVLFTEHVDMAGRGRSTIVKMKLLMTNNDEINEPERHGYRIVWLGQNYPTWALRSERVHEIYQADTDGDATYYVYETFSGPLAWAVKLFVGKTLVERFAQWNAELKGFVESDT